MKITNLFSSLFFCTIIQRKRKKMNFTIVGFFLCFIGFNFYALCSYNCIVYLALVALKFSRLSVNYTCSVGDAVDLFLVENRVFSITYFHIELFRGLMLAHNMYRRRNRKENELATVGIRSQGMAIWKSLYWRNSWALCVNWSN